MVPHARVAIHIVMRTTNLFGSVSLSSFAVAAVLAGAATGCSPDFDGDWNCTVQSTTSYTSPPGAGDYDGSGDYTMSSTDDGTYVIETRTNGGVGPTCPIHFKIGDDGVTGTLSSGQSCLNSVGNTVAFTKGAAKVDGDVLSGSYAFTVSGTADGGEPLMGSGTAQYTCTRVESSSSTVTFGD